MLTTSQRMSVHSLLNCLMLKLRTSYFSLFIHGHMHKDGNLRSKTFSLDNSGSHHKPHLSTFTALIMCLKVDPLTNSCYWHPVFNFSFINKVSNDPSPIFILIHSFSSLVGERERESSYSTFQSLIRTHN